MRILIKNGHVLDPKNSIDSVLDLYIEDGEIVQMEPQIDINGGDIEEIDASGLIVAPGLVDMHCHLRSHRIFTASVYLMPSTCIKNRRADIPPIPLDFQCHLLVSSLILKLSWS